MSAALEERDRLRSEISARQNAMPPEAASELLATMLLSSKRRTDPLQMRTEWNDPGERRGINPEPELAVLCLSLIGAAISFVLWIMWLVAVLLDSNVPCTL